MDSVEVRAASVRVRRGVAHGAGGAPHGRVTRGRHRAGPRAGRTRATAARASRPRARTTRRSRRRTTRRRAAAHLGTRRLQCCYDLLIFLSEYYIYIYIYYIVVSLVWD